tara:strand:- start:2013 stop:3044 length:1032 start_codon:yes stop_codon:yes gene_type:complete
MIKVKILNPTKCRNEPTFRPLLFVKDMLRDYSIDITDSNDYDFLFVGMKDFYDKNKSLKDSTDWGLENLNKITENGDYFLFDGQDSTSIMGSYEVFEQSDAIYMFKNQTLNNREDYKTPYSLSKWFFGSDNECGVSYDITENKWDRIKLSGYNLGSLLPHYHDFQPINSDKTIDMCAIYSAKHNYSEEHKFRNDLFYTKHRDGAWGILNDMKNKHDVRTAKLPFQEYIKVLHNSKLSLSPFGMGEICFRDFECMQWGTVIVKPNMSMVRTKPNIYIEDETYISVKPDWSDLKEKTKKVLGNFKNYSYIVSNLREKFKEEYSSNNLCLHWYNIFKNLNNVKETK